jgi:potassium channel subfamily K, other eukaryote
MSVTVVFIVYSLLAVYVCIINLLYRLANPHWNSPIMASFAVQAVTQVLTRISIWRLERRREDQGIATPAAPKDDRIITHAELLANSHKHYDTLLSDKARHSTSSDTTASNSAPSPAGDAERSEDDDLKTVQDANERLVCEMLDRAIALEAHARRMLIRHLPNGSRAQVLLKADRNVQLRDMRFLKRSQNTGLKKGEDQEGELLRHGRTVVKGEEKADNS